MHFSPSSGLKNDGIVNIAAPDFLEKMCRTSSRMTAPLSVHSDVQLVLKLRSAGGGPHVTVKLLPENISGGLKFKGVPPDEKILHVILNINDINETIKHFTSDFKIHKCVNLSYCQILQGT